MMKIYFHFTSKAPFVLKIFISFCLDFLVLQQNVLIRKIRLISKSISSQTGKQTIAIHVLPNILRNKDNWAMKFGQLTLSRRSPLSYRNQSIDLLYKSMDWFLYDNSLRLERVKKWFFHYFFDKTHQRKNQCVKPWIYFKCPW